MSVSKIGIQLAVFDLGRVMIRLCNGWKHACERAGVPYRPGFDAMDASLRERLLHLVYLNETGRLNNEQWEQQTAALVEMSPAQVQAISHAWLDGPYPGWDALLDRLDAVGVRTACLSNTNAVHWQMMHGEHPRHPRHPRDVSQRLPLDRLHFRFGSHLIGAHKPEPAIYRHVESQTGVAPESIVFFDDSPPNVEGARQCGWHAHAIDPKGDPAAQVAEHLRGHGVL